jgi:hypothetical protein
MTLEVHGGAGLLFVSAAIPPDRDEFYAWYFEHVRSRMAFPEFSWMSRGVSRTDPDHHVAVYGISDMAILKDPIYTDLRANRSARERAIMDTMVRAIDRSEWTARSGFGDVGGPNMLVVRMAYPVDDRRVPDWYVQRHLPFLETVPGWLGARTFERDTDDGVDGAREHVAIHWLTDPSVRQSEMLVEEKATDFREWAFERVTDFHYEEFRVHQWQVDVTTEEGASPLR